MIVIVAGCSEGSVAAARAGNRQAAGCGSRRDSAEGRRRAGPAGRPPILAPSPRCCPRSLAPQCPWRRDPRPGWRRGLARPPLVPAWRPMGFSASQAAERSNQVGQQPRDEAQLPGAGEGAPLRAAAAAAPAASGAGQGCNHRPIAASVVTSTILTRNAAACQRGKLSAHNPTHTRGEAAAARQRQAVRS